MKSEGWIKIVVDGIDLHVGSNKFMPPKYKKLHKSVIKLNFYLKSKVIHMLTNNEVKLRISKKIMH